jgi:hypothetical protein
MLPLARSVPVTDRVPGTVLLPMVTHPEERKLWPVSVAALMQPFALRVTPGGIEVPPNMLMPEDNPVKFSVPALFKVTPGGDETQLERVIPALPPADNPVMFKVAVETHKSKMRFLPAVAVIEHPESVRVAEFAPPVTPVKLRVPADAHKSKVGWQPPCGIPLMEPVTVMFPLHICRVGWPLAGEITQTDPSDTTLQVAVRVDAVMHFGTQLLDADDSGKTAVLPRIVAPTAEAATAVKAAFFTKSLLIEDSMVDSQPVALLDEDSDALTELTLSSLALDSIVDSGQTDNWTTLSTVEPHGSSYLDFAKTILAIAIVIQIAY